MHIDYEIKLNELLRPYIHLPKEYDNKPEDKFFVIELTRYILQGVLEKRSDSFDKYTANMIENCANILGQISDEIAMILYKNMVTLGDVAVSLGGNYHIAVKSIEERNALMAFGNLYNGKIFNRQENLKVLIFDPENLKNEHEIYQLEGGITNENWVKLS